MPCQNGITAAPRSTSVFRLNGRIGYCRVDAQHPSETFTSSTLIENAASSCKSSTLVLTRQPDFSPVPGSF